MLERLDRFRPKQLANAMQNVAKLGLFNEELVGGLLNVSEEEGGEGGGEGGGMFNEELGGGGGLRGVSSGR